MKTIEDQILFSAGTLTCSEQKLQDLKQLLVEKGQSLNYTNLFENSVLVPSQIYQHLSSLKFPDQKLQDFLSQLKSYQDFRNREWKFNFKQVEKISQRLEKDMEKSVMLIKGANLVHYYHPGTDRNIFDIDVLLPDLATSLRFVKVLKEEGYAIEKVRLAHLQHFQATDFNQCLDQIVGIIITSREGTDTYEGCSAFFDICIGAFPGYNNWVLDCPIWERASIDSRFPGFLAPSPEDNLLILLVHALRHGRLSIRDINDLYAVLSNEPYFDWEYFLEQIEKNKLRPIASLLLQMVVELYSWNLPDSAQLSLNLSKIENLSTFFLKKLNRPRNENFNRGGLPLQYLYNFNQHREMKSRRRFSHLFALNSILEMFKQERPYRTWSSRELQVFPSESMRIVFVPIIPQNNSVQWQVERFDLLQAKRVGTRLGIPIHQVDETLLFWNWKDADELILTFEGIYTQSSYDGNLSPTKKHRLSLAAASVTELLQKEGAVTATPLTLNG